MSEEVYYRTQLAEIFYSTEPGYKTPDPIAEFRVTVVSDVKDKYKPDNFKQVIIHLGIILSPQTWWVQLPHIVMAYEDNEPIDKDELPLSVPVYQRLNYAERYACFYRSRRSKSDWWRQVEPFWWEKEVFPNPRSGDYEYNEEFIKKVELDLYSSGRIRTVFDNEKGKLITR